MHFLTSPVIHAGSCTGFHPFMPGLGIGRLIAFFAIIVGLIGGFVCGAIRAFICNVAAGVVGAIQVELDAKA
jgi:hypothetical protein